MTLPTSEATVEVTDALEVPTVVRHAAGEPDARTAVSKGVVERTAARCCRPALPRADALALLRVDRLTSDLGRRVAALLACQLPHVLTGRLLHSLVNSVDPGGRLDGHRLGHGHVRRLLVLAPTHPLQGPAAALRPLLLGRAAHDHDHAGLRDLRRFGLLSIIPTAVFLSVTSLPFEIYLMKNFIDAVPEDLEEAARMERASTFQVLARVIVPLALPGIAAAAIFGFVNAWGSFIVPSS